MPSKGDFNKRIKLLTVLALFLALNIISLFVYFAISETAENETRIIKDIETDTYLDESNLFAADNLAAGSFAKILSAPSSSSSSSVSSSHSSSRSSGFSSSSSSSSNGNSCAGDCGIGSPDEECKDFGFDFGVAKWECEGGSCCGENSTWKIDEEIYPGTSVTGCCKNATWNVGSSVAEGIIVKAGNIEHGGYFYAVNGTSGNVILSKDISHITFCGYEDKEECGNDIIEEGEECENNSDCENPACEDKCMGNNYYDYEAAKNECKDCSCEDNECEVKNISYNDARCLEPPKCGDGKVDAGEECDDGNNVNGDGCDKNCMHEKECCKDGDCPFDFYSDKYCDNEDVYWNLTDYFCKDGDCLFNMSEVFAQDCGEDSCDSWGNYYCEGKNKTRERTCYDKGCSSGECFNTPDEEKQSEKCAYDCVNGECIEPKCGNSIKEDGEECDDGDFDNFDECRNDCTLPYCGDLILDLNEECEISNQCPEKCTKDSHKLYTEVNCDVCECDYSKYKCVIGKCGAVCESNDDCKCEKDYCNGTTRYDYPENSTCGTSGSESCLCTACTANVIYNSTECGYQEPKCGDGNVDAGEECDLGNDNGKECAPGYDKSCAYCSSECENKTKTDGYCGDDIINGPEECEKDSDCGNNCIFGFCLGTLTNKCVDCKCEHIEEPKCRDGIINQIWEECDDENNVNGDGCDENCTIERECTENSECDKLDRDYCYGSIIKHDEGICVDYECRVNESEIEDCGLKDGITGCGEFEWDCSEEINQVDCVITDILPRDDLCGNSCIDLVFNEGLCNAITYQCEYTWENCSDGNTCTEDICNTESGCSNPPEQLSTPCEADDLECTEDHCDGYGNCVLLEDNCDECCDDGDCLKDIYSDNYCYDNDIYFNLTDYFCKDGDCLFNMSEVFVQDCGEDSCDEPISYCKDNDVWKNQTCYNKGCSFGGCFNDPFTNKSKAEECGENSYGEWNNYCIGKEAWKNKTDVLKGCKEGGCYEENDYKNEKVETCLYDCINGECTEPECGDGNVDAGEECDLGNDNGKECAPGYDETCTYCSSECKNETKTDGYCGDDIINGPEKCEFDSQCNNNCIFGFCFGATTNKCVNCKCERIEEPKCGDGIINQIWEECDDGNNVNGDGCDKYCKTEGCPDTDHDCVCDQDDKCLNSRQGEMVNEDGCDPFQFCGQLSCGDGCSKLDFIPAMQNCEEIPGEPEGQYPGDCTTVIVHKEGIPEPRCTPTTCAD
ncbi:MAG: hypothetical protein Q8N63_06150 [Nanoarchaeota archaeon]|nr:hypothetical protein [Nanoarchaeota archaeon]